MRRYIPLLNFINTAFLVLSMLLLSGVAFTGAFVADFRIENQTPETIRVTPIGAYGKQAHRSLLPMVLSRNIAFDKFPRGGLVLAPGESVTIQYDMDDINFSEIAVEDERGALRQLVVDPTPEKNQYHGPSADVYAIDDLSRLPMATPEVAETLGDLASDWSGAAIFHGLLFGPWLAAVALGWLSRRYREPAVTPPPVAHAIAV